MNHYEETGIASLLPGMEHILQCIGTEVDRMLELVRGNESAPDVTETTATNGWSNRRNRRSTAAVRSWRKKTVKQKRAWVAAIQRGKKAKTKKAEERTQ